MCLSKFCKFEPRYVGLRNFHVACSAPVHRDCVPHLRLAPYPNNHFMRDMSILKNLHVACSASVHRDCVSDLTPYPRSHFKRDMLDLETFTLLRTNKE